MDKVFHPTPYNGYDYWPVLELWSVMVFSPIHYTDVIMGTMASQITNLTIVYSTVYTDADQRKHQSSKAQMASNAENGSIWWRHHAYWSYAWIVHCRVTLVITFQITAPLHTQEDEVSGAIWHLISDTSAMMFFFLFEFKLMPRIWFRYRKK